MLVVLRSNVRGDLSTGSKSGFLHAADPRRVNGRPADGQPVRNIVLAVGARIQGEDRMLQVIKRRSRSLRLSVFIVAGC